MRTILSTMTALSLMLAVGCNVDPEDENPEEVITTVGLVFTPQGGGDAVSATWADPEDDGRPVIADITLTAGTTYDLAITILNTPTAMTTTTATPSASRTPSRRPPPAPVSCRSSCATCPRRTAPRSRSPISPPPCPTPASARFRATAMWTSAST